MIKEAFKNFFETIKSLFDKTDKTQAAYIRKIAEENKERAEQKRKEKEEIHYKENCKIIENIVNEKITKAAKKGEYFVEIYRPTLQNSITLFNIFKKEYKEYYKTRGYTFEFKNYSDIDVELVKIGWEKRK